MQAAKPVPLERADRNPPDAGHDPAIKTADRFIVFGEPEILEEDIEEVVACLRSNWIGTGPRVARFERDFAAFKGVSQAAAVGSCSAALHLSMLVAGIQSGDEVITTPLTFCGTVNAIIHAGGQPVLADIDPTTMNLSPAEVEARVTPRTRAIIPVHFAGRPCQMDALRTIASRHGLLIIEDCAHAIEAEYHGAGAGTFGDFGCFSFYATKNVTTGEGGMVLARRPEDLEAIRIRALHGMTTDAWRRFDSAEHKQYLAAEIGFKYNLSDLQASLGIHQLRRVSVNWERRCTIWSRYIDALQKAPVQLPAPEEPLTRHARHLFTMLIDDRKTGISRNKFLDGMTRRRVGVGVHYVSVAEHPVYQKRLGWRPEEWPVAQRIGRQTVSLPLGPKLTDHDLDRVVSAVFDTLRRPLASPVAAL